MSNERRSGNRQGPNGQPGSPRSKDPDGLPERQGFDESGRFYNPYAFLFARDRPTGGSPLADALPPGHGAVVADTFSGVLHLTLTTETPLLIPDASRAEVRVVGVGEDGKKIFHRSYPCRRNAQGEPLIPVSSFKGMLRSWYEAVTNSRFGIFGDHDAELGFRTANGKCRYSSSPAALLPESLHPATDVRSLSPAERVFGFVAQKGDASCPTYRGHLRIEPLRWQSRGRGADKVGEAFKTFGKKGLALAILGEPDPKQARFYTATEDGRPLNGKSDGELYKKHHRLAGRKVYPHHGQAYDVPGYWKPGPGKVSQLSGSSYREYVRRWTSNGGESALRDGQNRSVLDWVVPDECFDMRIHFDNLSAFECGALLWLLGRGEAHFRLGSGKPLGFGSVSLRLQTQTSSLQSADAQRAAYAGLPSLDSPAWNTELAAQVEADFVRAVSAWKYGGPLLAGVEAALAGFAADAPAHYPRCTVYPPGGEEDKKAHIYKWFTENKSGPRLGLTPLGGAGEFSPDRLLLPRCPRRPRQT